MYYQYHIFFSSKHIGDRKVCILLKTEFCTFLHTIIGFDNYSFYTKIFKNALKDNAYN